MSTQSTATHRTPACFVCGQASLVQMARLHGRGNAVQEVVHGLPRTERELLVSGTHPACWATAFTNFEQNETASAARGWRPGCATDPARARSS